MSVCRNCEFFEYQPGSWYYIVENTNSPKNCWDWTEPEYSEVCGPFRSQDEAHTHLHENHANPGGYYNYPHEEVKENQERFDKYVKRARSTAPRATIMRFKMYR
jgi:hypothetical protein